MASAELNGGSILGWDTFHEECKRAFGFPDSYGNTMDAWVDCLSYLRDEDGMTRFRLKPVAQRRPHQRAGVIESCRPLSS